MIKYVLLKINTIGNRELKKVTFCQHAGRSEVNVTFCFDLGTWQLNQGLEGGGVPS